MDLIELAVKIYSLGNTNGNQKLLNKTLSTLYFILDELTDSNISKFAAEYPRYPLGGQLNLNENLRKFLSLLSSIIFNMSGTFLEVLDLQKMIMQLHSINLSSNPFVSEYLIVGDTLISQLLTSYNFSKLVSYH
jgi:hypothetical protein